MKRLSLFLILILLWFGYGEAQIKKTTPRPKQTTTTIKEKNASESKPYQTVRLTIKQDFGKYKDLNLPLEKILTNFLDNTKVLKVVKNDIKHSDATLKLEVKANVLTRRYGVLGKNWWEGELGYSGVELYINFHFETSDGFVRDDNFYSQMKPPVSIYENEFKTPADAPFKEAFHDSGLYDGIAEVIRHLYGEKPLVGYWIGGLMHPWSKRRAVVALREIKDGQAIEPLIRVSEYEALIDFNKPAIGPLILELKKLKKEKEKKYPNVILLYPSPEDRKIWEIWFTLAKMGETTVIPDIISSLEGSNFPKEEAIAVLEMLKDKRAITPLVALLKDKFSWSDRGDIAKALAKIGGRQVVNHLIDALKVYKDEGEAEGIIEALGEIGDEKITKLLLEFLIAKVPPDNPLYYGYRREKAAEALVKIGDKSITNILTSDLERDEDKIRQIWIAFVLYKFGDNTKLTFLTRLLEDKDSYVRMFTVRALAKIGKSTIEYLISAFKDEDRSVKTDAANGLGEIGDVKAVEPLISALNNDKDKFVRTAAATALGKIGDTQAISHLIKALGEANWYHLESLEPARKEFNEALKKITGKDFCEAYGAWIKWWEKQKKEHLKIMPRNIDQKKE